LILTKENKMSAQQNIPNNGQTVQTKVSLLIFLKGSVAPIVLYFENPKVVYEDMRNILRAQEAPKLIELEALGPIKKVCLVSSDISGISLQEEQYMVNPKV